MNNNNYSKARVLTLIPVVVLVATGICMVLATILGEATDRGALYSAFAFGALMSVFLAPMPCLVMSVIGTKLAAKAKKEGTPEAQKYFILGLLEVLVYIVGAVVAVIMFIGGQGV